MVGGVEESGARVAAEIGQRKEHATVCHIELADRLDRGIGHWRVRKLCRQPPYDMDAVRRGPTGKIRDQGTPIPRADLLGRHVLWCCGCKDGLAGRSQLRCMTDVIAPGIRRAGRFWARIVEMGRDEYHLDSAHQGGAQVE